jgi:hypothetical protein
MKTKRPLIIFALLISLGSLTQAAPLGTAFTYQGSLTDGGSPANGTYDLKFMLYSSGSGGNALSGPITNSPVGVTNGLFTVDLDFGSACSMARPVGSKSACAPTESATLPH